MATAIDGVLISKVVQPAPPSASMTGTVFALIAQGAKRLALGERVYEYRAGQYLIASVDLPVTGHFTEASPDRPALGFGLVLDPSAIAELLLQVGVAGLPRTGRDPVSGIAVSDASGELIDAVVRLLRLLDQPRGSHGARPADQTGDPLADRHRRAGRRRPPARPGRQRPRAHRPRGPVDPRPLHAGLPGGGRRAGVRDERVRLPPQLPGGHRDEPDPVPEADPAPGGPAPARHPPQRRHRGRPPRRLRQPVTVQPRVPPRCSVPRRAWTPLASAARRRPRRSAFPEAFLLPEAFPGLPGPIPGRPRRSIRTSAPAPAGASRTPR